MKTRIIPPAERKDSVLIRIFQKGYDHAFTVLVKRYSHQLKLRLRKKLHDTDLEKDVLQDTWQQVFQQLRSQRYVEQGRFAQWLHRLAYCNAMTALRKKKRFVHGIPERDIEKTLSYEPVYFQKEQAEQMKKALNVLNKRMRTIVILRVQKDLAFDTIARRLRCSVSSVTSAYSKAIKKLRKFYEEEGEWGG